MRSSNLVAAVLVCTCAICPAHGQDLTARKEPLPAPADIAEPVRSLLAGDATVVKSGDNRVELWWVKGMQLDTKPAGAPTWSSVADGALVGAVRLSAAMPDIRGVSIKPGVYTLRFALQPENGDHVGVSPYREFLLVCPVAEDVTPDPAGYKGAVALAKKTVGKSHPAALSLDPPVTDQAPGTPVTNEAGHKGITMAVPLTFQGSPAGALTFGLILIGQYEH